MTPADRATATDPTNWLVLTTVHAPGPAVRQLLAQLGRDWGVAVVGDAKTPADWADQPVEFLSLERQRELFGAFAADAPLHHYARKNFGYLYALRRGASAILDVDDDGAPLAGFGAPPARSVCGRLVGGGDWANVYGWFTDRLIWPRGLPLDAIHRRGELFADGASRDCPVQQFLVDDDPDVDAIYRLVFPHTGFAFDPGAAPVLLAPGTWCPFNSQNTLWFADAFPLLYLPHGCSFRVTDIWRALVAQCALWVAGCSLAFRASTLRQSRNPHDLNRDFADEIPAWTRNRAIAECLDHAAARLAGGSLSDTGRALWLSLVEAGLLPTAEAALIDAWFDAVRPHRS
jgi:hypothetical protein